jgi:hypothetical protein
MLSLHHLQLRSPVRAPRHGCGAALVRTVPGCDAETVSVCRLRIRGDAGTRSSSRQRAEEGTSLQSDSGVETVRIRSKPERPFWQARYYDFNVHNEENRVEKLRYMHRNPVKRGLVAAPEEWPWSSFRHYATGEIGTVEIESQWTAVGRGNQLPAHLRYREGAG